jgi:hypothetical protein
VPEFVFVNITNADRDKTIGYLVEDKARIVFSTDAMIIVVTILAILIAALVALPWWTKSWERTLIDLKREPDVLGAVLSYICDSPHLMAMFQGQTFTSLQELKAFLKKSGKKFRIGKFIGDDGELYYGIEIEDQVHWVDDMDEEASVELRSLASLPAVESTESTDGSRTRRSPSNNLDTESPA